jgi:hypothetical protein
MARFAFIRPALFATRHNLAVKVPPHQERHTQYISSHPAIFISKNAVIP